jgi:hypothetical protein
MYCLILLIGSIQLRHDDILIFRSYKTKLLYTKWGHIILLKRRISAALASSSDTVELTASGKFSECNHIL